MFRSTTIAVLIALPLAVACTAKSSSVDPIADAGVCSGTQCDDAGTIIEGDGGVLDKDGGGTDPSFATSTKANLRFKRNERLQNDFAQAVGLPPGQICNELGQYSCTEFVHTIALGGVEPYVLGLNEPFDDTTVTTPIAVDRLALSACTQRADRDLETPGEALIYVGLDIDNDGNLVDVNAPAVGTAIDGLYKRAVQRPAKESELAHMRQLYRDIAATGPNAARDWAILSCYAVLTSVESLFY